MVQRWTFHEPVDDETYTVQINPNEGGTPAWVKTLHEQTTLGGRSVISEGPPEPQRIDASGVILDRDHLEGLVNLWRKRRQVLLTDDLGRQWWVYVTSLQPTRRRSRRAWRHDYQISCVVLDVVDEFGAAP